MDYPSRPPMRDPGEVAYRTWRVEKGDGVLAALIGSLEILVALLRRDSSCTWTDGFEQLLARSLKLQSTEFNQADLTSLSGHVRSVYGGMCSFNDYIPYDHGNVAYWVDELDRARREVFMIAVNLQAELD